MNYSPPDVEQREIVECPNWLWAKPRGWGIALGQTHYFDEQANSLCKRPLVLARGYLANESDAEHICGECLTLRQTRN